MKSAFTTLIILIVIFASLKAGVLNIVGSPVFHYLCFALFIAVFATAYFLIGFEDKGNSETNNLPMQSDTEQEVDNDK